MKVKIRHQVKGLSEFKTRLRELEKAVRNRILRKAVNAASRITLRAMKAKAPVETGQLRRSLGRRIRTYRNSGLVVAIIGPRSGFKDPATGRNPTHYAHLVEFGTQEAPAHPFVRPAFDSTVKAAEAAMAQVIREELTKLAG